MGLLAITGVNSVDPTDIAVFPAVPPTGPPTAPRPAEATVLKTLKANLVLSLDAFTVSSVWSVFLSALSSAMPAKKERAAADCW